MQFDNEFQDLQSGKYKGNFISVLRTSEFHGELDIEIRNDIITGNIHPKGSIALGMIKPPGGRISVGGAEVIPVELRRQSTYKYLSNTFKIEIKTITANTVSGIYSSFTNDNDNIDIGLFEIKRYPLNPREGAFASAPPRLNRL